MDDLNPKNVRKGQKNGIFGYLELYHIYKIKKNTGLVWIVFAVMGLKLSRDSPILFGIKARTIRSKKFQKKNSKKKLKFF